MKWFICIFGLLWIQAATGAEKQSEGVRPENRREVRFLTVGDMPPFRQVIENGVRREVPPPSGSIPPRTVSVRVERENEEKTLGEVELRLGRLSSSLEIPAGQGRLLIGQGGWAEADIPEQGDVLVVLWRNPGADSWKSARSLVVKEDHRAGMTRVMNLAPRKLAIVQGNEKILLPVCKPLARRFGSGSPVPFQVGVPTDNGFKRVAAMSLEQGVDERSMVFVYLADGMSPRQPVKVLVLRERTRS